jgi:hypothetical protein
MGAITTLFVRRVPSGNARSRRPASGLAGAVLALAATMMASPVLANADAAVYTVTQLPASPPLHQSAMSEHSPVKLVLTTNQ